jgi:pimeloyl-ACP methyl ester carboxylesterase
MASKRGRGARECASVAKILAVGHVAARTLEIVAAVLVIAATLAVIVVEIFPRSWPAAQLDAVAVLATTEHTPVLAWFVRALTREPRVEETVVAGAPSTVVRPGRGRGPWPAIVFVNGATREGRHHPKVQRLAQGLARTGFLVVVPDLPGLREGEITPETADATARVAETTSDRPDVRGGRVGFYGVSVGAALALLAAERRELASRVTIVGGEAPWTDLKRIARLATTGDYDGRPYTTDPYASLAIARSLAAGLPPSPGRSRLVRHLGAVSDDDPEPLAGLDAAAYDDGPRALVELLLNREPDRFEALYARLPEQVRLSVETLSPLRHAGRLVAPVQLASSPHDKYFPPAESEALARHAPRVHVTVTSTLDHAVPHPSLGDLRDFFRFDGFVVRVLHDARR